jgi:hypothetical protein
MLNILIIFIQEKDKLPKTTLGKVAATGICLRKPGAVPTVRYKSYLMWFLVLTEFETFTFNVSLALCSHSMAV